MNNRLIGLMARIHAANSIDCRPRGKGLSKPFVSAWIVTVVGTMLNETGPATDHMARPSKL